MSADSTSSWSYQTQVTSTVGSASSAASASMTAQPPFMSTVPRPQSTPSSRRLGRLSFTGHRVDVARDHDPRGRPEVRARDDRVAVADHLEVCDVGQRGLDGVGELGLVARHRLDVDELPRQLERGRPEVEGGHGASLASR